MAKTRKQARQCDRESAKKLDSSTHKTVYLIRHGESQGQAAWHNGLDRKRDPSLMDAGLTRKGQAQAKQMLLLLGKEVMDSIELVVSSPLTRALHTALLGFDNRSKDSSLVVHYDIREIGSRIPENKPRPIEQVLNDLEWLPRVDQVDHESLKPEDWPDGQQHKTSGKSDTKETIQDFLMWLAKERDEGVIAVVCHYNVIRAMLGPEVHPKNAMPIACNLWSDGTLLERMILER